MATMNFSCLISSHNSLNGSTAVHSRGATVRRGVAALCLITLLPTAHAFTPADLDGLALWLDASDSATVQTETGVSVWEDKSGHGRDVAQSNATWQPAYVANGIQGHPAIDFDNTDDRLVREDAALLLAVGGGSAFIVARPKANNSAWGGYVAIYTTNQVRFLLSQTSPTGGGIAGLSASGRRLASDSLQQLVHSMGYSSGAFIGGMEADYSNATLSVYYNGAGESRSFQSSGLTEDNAGALHIGYFSNPLNALIGEIIVVESVLSTDTRQDVEGYLAWKWGLQDSLPENHPHHPDILNPPNMYEISFLENNELNDVSIQVYTDLEYENPVGTPILTSDGGAALKELRNGEYFFIASLAGFRGYEGTFMVDDSGLTISFELEPVPHVATLTAEVTPLSSTTLKGELTSLGGHDSVQVSFRYRQKNKVLHEGGIWTVHDRPRALRHLEYTFVPWTNAQGKVGITQYNHVTNQAHSQVIGTVPNHVGDDHWGPSVFVRTDGRLLVPYSRTGGFVAISEHPLDISSWNVTRYDWLRDYGQMMQIGDEIWMFYRPSGHFVGEWSYRVSADQGNSWSVEKRLFKGASSDTGIYVHPFHDTENDRIHFGMGDHRQNEPGVYHWYLDLADGYYYTSDGTPIKHAGDGTNPITHTSELTLAFEIPADWDGAKIWDLKVKDGVPYIAFAGYPQVDAGGGGGGDYRAMWAVWRGSPAAWHHSQIRKLGGSIGEGHYYEGGLVLDYEDPTHAYLAVETNNRNFQIQEWKTPDQGQTWEKVADHSPSGADRYSPTKRARPVSPYGHNGEMPLVYWSGKYDDRFKHDTVIKASFGWKTTTPITLTEPQSFEAHLEGLHAESDYEFHTVVEHADETYEGNTVTFATGSADYATWQNLYFSPAELEDPDVSDPTATPITDGIPNLLKYALGLSPWESIAEQQMQHGVTTEGLQYFRFHRDPAKSEIIYLVETSLNLVDWDEIIFDSSSVPTEKNTDGIHHEIKLEIDGVNRRFLRLRVEWPSD